MASLTAEAQQLITRDRLGSPLNIFGPHTVLSIIGGLFLMAFAVMWIWFTLSIFGNSLLPANLTFFNLLFQAAPPSFSPDPSGTSSTFNTIFTIMGIVFPLFGVLFFFSGLWNIFRAIYNHGIRAVICTYGVAYVRPSSADSFRWQDVLTTFHRVNVYTSHNQSSGATTTSVRHTYTVHCHDGRKFVFKPPLARVEDLGESIEVQVARMKQFMSQGQPRAY